MNPESWPNWLLHTVNYFFYIFHTVVILFNLLGWLFRPTRRLNLVVLGLTLFSWGVLGFWKGFGYCFLTDWHYDILYALGERGMPGNYIAFLIEKATGWLPPELWVNWGIGIGMTVAVTCSLWVNFFRGEKK